ncbi:Ferric reductase [Colletotrichum higginsianum IMI 349063]|uniref:Ferric reductase n=1 Tax=Colletotrichum higginsianum (strain IMI 349063) TaxID=759273 RepID=A0A1B7Y8S2_COLHI|nr:Ferric reductase [Colletotrichum higginsianum IMI 349063]OBR08367.1 Ferric reductase [Colletotrichum higginsianum IMI 349063]
MNQLLCNIVLFLTFAVSAAAVIVLTFVPCYATICSEDYFDFETRLHLIIYYGLLAVLGIALLLRKYFPRVRTISGHHLLPGGPLVSKSVTVGGLLASVWIVGVTASTTVFWLPAQWDFWGQRADPLGWMSAKIQLTITGVTGHYADILLGLLIIPVSRNSLIGKGLSLHQSTLLFMHKMVAYLYSAAATAHGITYIIYASDSSSEGDEAKEEAFATGNPAMTLSESKQRSEWFTLTTYTGIAAILPVWIIVITSIPWIRRNHYNFFYYNHVLFGLVIFVAASIHASTDFYLLMPGLLLWLADWACRIFAGEAGGLSSKTSATLENAGNGWLRITLPPLRKLDDSYSRVIALEEKGRPSFQPLLYYHLQIPAISRLQNHAFTAAIPSSIDSGPVFLLQPTTGKSQRRLNKEWTWKLASLVSEPLSTKTINVRAEGPYGVGDNGFETASHLICIVGGTGITGACSLAHWWLERRPENTFFTLVWTVRDREASMIREWTDLQQTANSVPNLTTFTHVSSEIGRVVPSEHLNNALALAGGAVASSSGHAWVYSSGPTGLLDSVEKACIGAQKSIRVAKDEKGASSWAVQDIGWYVAKWEV